MSVDYFSELTLFRILSLFNTSKHIKDEYRSSLKKNINKAIGKKIF